MILVLGSTALRLATEDDAEFILSLRTDSQLNRFLSKTDSDVKAQREWLREYKCREADSKEYYFIIVRTVDDSSIGTVRLYDFKKETKSFCWGSWILNEKKSRYSAIQSAFLIYQFAFEQLGFERSHFNVHKANAAVVNFHRKFGAQIVGEGDIEYFFNIEKGDVLLARERLAGLLG